MKKNVFVFLGMLVLTSCLPLTEMETDLPVFPVTFSVDLQKEVLPFPYSRSNSDGLISEEVPSYTQLEYLVYPENEDKMLKKRHYSLEDGDFGVVYDTLPVGKYRVALLAHSSINPTFTSANSFIFKEVSDSFFLLQNFEVAVAKENQHDITLERVVSQLEFASTDEISTTLKQFDMEVTNYANVFSIFALPVEPASQKKVFSHVFLPEEVGSMDYKHGFYTFVPMQSKKMTVKLSAIKKDNSVSCTQTVEVTPEQNKIVRYTGKLYTFTEANDRFNVAVNAAWGGVKEEPLLGN